MTFVCGRTFLLRGERADRDDRADRAYRADRPGLKRRGQG